MPLSHRVYYRWRSNFRVCFNRYWLGNLLIGAVWLDHLVEKECRQPNVQKWKKPIFRRMGCYCLGWDSLLMCVVRPPSACNEQIIGGSIAFAPIFWQRNNGMATFGTKHALLLYSPTINVFGSLDRWSSIEDGGCIRRHVRNAYPLIGNRLSGQVDVLLRRSFLQKSAIPFFSLISRGVCICFGNRICPLR